MMSLREVWDFSMYSDSDLKEILFYINKLESMNIDVGSDTMKRELHEEIKKRDIDEPEPEINVVLRLDSYRGGSSSLEANTVTDDGQNKEEMWVIAQLEGDQVKQDLTDYGYRSKEEAEDVAETLADIVIS
jgi:hypothetical protein